MINKSELFEYILGSFKSALGIASPSKVMRDHYEIYAEEERKKERRNKKRRARIHFWLLRKQNKKRWHAVLGACRKEWMK